MYCLLVLFFVVALYPLIGVEWFVDSSTFYTPAHALTAWLQHNNILKLSIKVHSFANRKTHISVCYRATYRSRAMYSPISRPSRPLVLTSYNQIEIAILSTVVYFSVLIALLIAVCWVLRKQRWRAVHLRLRVAMVTRELDATESVFVCLLVTCSSEPIGDDYTIEMRLKPAAVEWVKIAEMTWLGNWWDVVSVRMTQVLAVWLGRCNFSFC